MAPSVPSNLPPVGRIGLFAAMAIGIGGMIGAGIFSILGVVAQASGGALWISFAIGGVVALLSSYSYAKLGARYPSAGGAVEFLVKGFGDGVVSGGINISLWIGYIIALALYAQGFAGYACVHAAHLRLTAQTGGNPWIVRLALVSCLVMLGILSVYIWRHSRPALVLLLALMPLCCGLEWIYRRLTGLVIKTRT